MKIIITGGTGFIGTRLIATLSKEEHEIVILTRAARPQEQRNAAVVRYVQWDAKTFGAWAKEVNGADAIINLTGKNTFEQRWTSAVKQELIESRIGATRLLVEAIRQASNTPSLLVSASAVGYYGDTHDAAATENLPRGNDFLSELTNRWEQESQQAVSLDVRVVNPRFGVVIGKHGGAIATMMLPFRFFVGGYLGSGKQFFPWIHIDDAVQAIVFPLHHAKVSGAYNVTAPQSVTMKDFCAALGKAMRRPSWTFVPSCVLRLALGEASSMLLSGQNASPKKITDAGFRFTFPLLEDALNDVMK